MTKRQISQMILSEKTEEEINDLKEKLKDKLLARNTREFLDESLKLSRLEERKKQIDNSILELSFLSCNHIWVSSKATDGDFISPICVKCGLDSGVSHRGFSMLTPREHLMNRVILSSREPGGKYICINASFEAVKETYNRIIDSNPNLSDDEIITQLKRYTKRNVVKSDNKILSKKLSM